MYQSIRFLIKSQFVRNLLNHLPLARGFLLIPLATVCLALSPAAYAQLNPPPGGGYPTNNTALGDDALYNGTGTLANTAIGFDALFSNNLGSSNTAIGSQTLASTTSGNSNTASGSLALYFNATGNDNTAAGVSALFNNTTGGNNTASGSASLFSNTTAGNNTAAGFHSLYYNTTGASNTAVGSDAMTYNTTGGSNTAVGSPSFYTNTTGFNDTAVGAYSLQRNTTGYANAAIGYSALFANTTGYSNAATGFQALFGNTTGYDSTANGMNALYYATTGHNNIALGFNAGAFVTTGSNNIEIGHSGFANDNSRIRIGTPGTQSATFIAGIYGVTVNANGMPAVVDSFGRLGTVVSSARFKEAIKPMDQRSEAILSLQPVTFRYKKELDPEKTTHFGLVAEEVEKVDPALVIRDEQGKPFTVRYEAVNAMLLNEFLKEHRKVEEQGTNIGQLQSLAAEQQKQIKALTASLKDQAAQIQKVSAQVAVDRSAPRVVALDR